ncbi:MAG: efflux RND transporter permease subunit [Rikenellaceae bacterium]
MKLNNKTTDSLSFLDRVSSFSLMLIMVIFTIMGAALIPTINVSHYPSQTEGKTINVNFAWSGASPRLIEQEVTSKIEGFVSSVKGVESVSSKSNVGSGSVAVTLKKGVNVSSTRFEISSLLKQLDGKLPDGVSPYISGGNVASDNSESKLVLNYCINADMNQEQIQEYAIENIEPYIMQIPQVSHVTISGGAPQYLEVTYDPVALNQYGLKGDDIVSSLKNFIGRSYIIGDVEHFDKVTGEISRITLNLETSKMAPDISKIEVANIEGKIIYLGSIATMNFKEQELNNYYRINGMNTVYLNVYVEDDANLISMSEKVRGKIESLKDNLIDNYYVELTHDAAEAIKAELEKLKRRTFLSFVILLLFVWIVSRSFRYLSIIAITLISNLLIAVILYYIFDIELHIFSLAGIAVAFGIVIDTSIVMVDHYSYYRNRKVFLAILAALLTTIGSLVIIFFMPEDIRKDLSDFSAVIIINLSVSLVVSLLFVPALIEKYKYQSKEAKRTVATRRMIVKFSSFYIRYITFTQKRKWIYITLMVLAFGLPVHLLPSKIKTTDDSSQTQFEQKMTDFYNKTIGGSLYQQKIKQPLECALGGALRLFSSKSVSRWRAQEKGKMELHIKAQMPQGGSAAQVNDKVVTIENLLLKYDEIERFVTKINGRTANIDVYFTDEAVETAFPYLLENEVINTAVLVGGVDWSTYGVSEKGFSNSLNIGYRADRIILSGYNYDRLYGIAEQLCEILKNNRRVTDVDIESTTSSWYSAAEDSEEMYIKYDMEKVAFYDLDLQSGYSALNNMVNTFTVEKGNSSMLTSNIIVASSERDKFDVWSLFNSYVDVGDIAIKYSDLSSIGKRKARTSIEKVNQEYSMKVAFNYLGSYEMKNKYVKETILEFNTILPLGFKSESPIYGYYTNQDSQYWLLLLIVAIIFFVCSILFESILKPLVIISLIPISFIGTFLTFYFSGVNFGTGGFASLVLLSGLVVNAAIYIINEYNNSSKYHVKSSKVRVYVRAYNHKIIAVLLTIISTVLGLVPFLIDGAKEQFWFSFAIGAMGGLLFSILALLFLMPILMPLKEKR